MIGDPGGKDSERSFLDIDTLTYNVNSITTQVDLLLTHLEQISGHSLKTSVQVIDNSVLYD